MLLTYPRYPQQLSMLLSLIGLNDHLDVTGGLTILMQETQWLKGQCTGLGREV